MTHSARIVVLIGIGVFAYLVGAVIRDARMDRWLKSHHCVLKPFSDPHEGPCYTCDTGTVCR